MFLQVGLRWHITSRYPQKHSPITPKKVINCEFNTHEMKNKTILIIACAAALICGYLASTIDSLFYLGVFLMIIAIGGLVMVLLPLADYFD